MMDTETQRLDEQVRLAHHHFEKMKKRLEAARAAARDTRISADREARLRAEKEFNMALARLGAAVAQSASHTVECLRSMKIPRTTKGRKCRRS